MARGIPTFCLVRSTATWTAETAAHRVSEVLRLERQLVAEGALIIAVAAPVARENRKRLKA